MPPKSKITRDDIILCALDIVRKQGIQSLNARAIASELGCSTQPIFSHFTGMDELTGEVIRHAYSLFDKCMQKEVQAGIFPEYKASGMAYIRFAREEKELFKLLYMRNRHDAETPEENKLFSSMVSMVNKNTGIEHSRAELFHLEMWAFVHGIASMTATGYLDLDMDTVSTMITDVFQGVRSRYDKKE